MSRNFISGLVQLSSEFDLDITVYLALKQKNTRQEQKIKTLRKYVNKHTSGWKKQLELADLLYETGQWKTAIVEYKKVIEKRPRLIHPYIQIGKIFQFISHEKDAVAIYTTAIVFAKYDATKAYLKGLIASCLQDRYGAISAFKTAADMDAKCLTPRLALGKMQMAIESPIAALSSFENILSIDPNDFISLIYSHDLLLQLGNLSEAENRLNRATEIAPNDIQTLKRTIAHRYRQKLVNGIAGKQTKQLISTLMTQANSLPEAHSLLARYYLLREQTQKGLQIIQCFAKERTHNPQAWYYYSLYLQALDETELAAEALLKAYDLSKDRCDREIYRALCRILPQLGRKEQTRDLITEMLEKFPESWSLWAIAGNVLVEHFNEVELGRRYAQNGTCLQPQLAEAWFRYGKVLALAEDHSTAITALRRGWDLQYPGSQSLTAVSAAVWMGQSQQKLGQHKVSQHWFKQASKRAQALLTHYPDEAQYWYNRAEAALTIHSDNVRFAETDNKEKM